MSDKRPVAIEDLERVWAIGAVSWHPDQKQVAISLARPVLEGDRYQREVRLVDLETGRTTPVSPADWQSTSPAWSPDGTRLAYLVKLEGGPQDLAVWSPGGGTHLYPKLLPEGVGGFVWAPDSRRLCLVAPSHVPPRDETAPRVIERLPYKSDGVGFTFDARSNLHVFDLEPERLDQVTDGEWEDSAPAWSPDGTRIAFVSARHETRGRDLGTDLFVVHVTSGELTQLTGTVGGVGEPAWSPDGSLIAYSGTERLRSAPNHHRIRVIPAAGGASRDVSSGWDRTVSGQATGGLHWLGEDRVAALFEDEGRVTWAAFDTISGERVAGGQARPWQLATWDLSPDRTRLAFAASSVTQPPELWVQDLADGEPRQITHLHDAWLADVSLSDAEAFDATSEDGTPVPAWFLPPVGREDGERAPVMLRIHGGPYSQYGTGFQLEFQYWAGRGYGIVFGNPRGSSGYTEAWARDLSTHRGTMDQQDVLATLDEALRRWPWLDAERQIVEGYSYGGYLTNWLIGHTDRFRVACTGAGPANLYSQQGHTDVTATNYPMTQGCTILDNPEHYRQMSPLTAVNDIHTPVLIIHGENDMRVPISQGEELFSALALRDAPVRFIRFPGASHGFVRLGRPSHRKFRLEEMTAWFDRWLGAEPERAAEDERPAPVAVGARDDVEA